MDNDGDLDVLTLDESSITLQYLENNNGNFTPIDLGIPSLAYSTITLCDYDNDGDLDYYIQGGLELSFGSEVFSGLYTNQARTNLKPSTPTNINTTVIGNTISVNWDMSIDDHTNQTGLNYELAVGTSEGAQDIRAAHVDKNGKRMLTERGSINTTEYSLNDLTPGDYYITIVAIDAAFNASGLSNTKVVTIHDEAVLPTLSTLDNISVTDSGVYALGFIQNDGGVSLDEFGILWSTEATPTLSSSERQIASNSDKGYYNVELENAQPGQVYYYRAYATNSVGVSYGDIYSFIIPLVTSTNISNTGSSVNLYPNPYFSGKLYLKGFDSQSKISVSTIDGKRVFESVIEKEYVDLSFLLQGIYTVSFINDEEIITLKLIKQN